MTFEYPTLTLGRKFASGLAPLMLTAVLFAGLAACSSAPVQEMSDARQAVTAAEAAGAAQYAPDTLKQAQALLLSAQEKLDRKHFSDARRDAKEAKKHALEALHVAEGASRPESR